VATTSAVRVWTGVRPLREAFGDLIWSRPRLWRRELVLEAGSERLASLVWPKVFGYEAVAESADGRWILTRHRAVSLLGGCLVRDAATGAEVATFRRSWRSTGTVRFASGAEYTWAREGFWRAKHFWMGPDQRPLVTFQSQLGWQRVYEMTVDPAARALSDLPVLVLLGAYAMSLASSGKHGH